MHRIFISYKRVDKEKVFAIKSEIESALGEKCWIDLDGIESDAQFMNVIIKAIKDSEIVLFMYSAAHSKIVDFEKDWTVRELNFASKKDKRIVFVNIDGSSLTDEFEFVYGTKQQVDGTSNESLSRLIKDLKKWLAVSEDAQRTDTPADGQSVIPNDAGHPLNKSGVHFNKIVSPIVEPRNNEPEFFTAKDFVSKKTAEGITRTVIQETISVIFECLGPDIDFRQEVRIASSSIPSDLAFRTLLTSAHIQKILQSDLLTDEERTSLKVAFNQYSAAKSKYSGSSQITKVGENKTEVIYTDANDRVIARFRGKTKDYDLFMNGYCIVGQSLIDRQGNFVMKDFFVKRVPTNLKNVYWIVNSEGRYACIKGDGKFLLPWTKSLVGGIDSLEDSPTIPIIEGYGMAFWKVDGSKSGIFYDNEDGRLTVPNWNSEHPIRIYDPEVELYGFVKSNGELVIPCQYVEASEFYSSPSFFKECYRAEVIIQGEGGVAYEIDESGEAVSGYNTDKKQISIFKKISGIRKQ